MTKKQKVKRFLKTVPQISRGRGTKDEMSSFAAINLALRGKLSVAPIKCASLVAWYWGSAIQDVMPHFVRNSDEWRSVLCLVPGTGRDVAEEHQRLEIVMDWMWTIVLPQVRDIAKELCYASEWNHMLRKRSTFSAVDAAERAAKRAANKCAHYSYGTGGYQRASARRVAAGCLVDAVKAADAAAFGVSRVLIRYTVYQTAAAAEAAAEAAAHGVSEYVDASKIILDPVGKEAYAAAWAAFDPAITLERLCAVDKRLT